ncbi:hypothetical protein SEUCBS139899_007461 [Sporothrix eucalyptigena]|uniref:Uncharacterized protein n=1 Tax=Sporothrix eucalyptigena TaxID=1812306 RepID=A0ABP0B9S6_9PEZI
MLLVHLLCWATATVLAIPPPVGSDGSTTAASRLPHPPHGMLPLPAGVSSSSSTARTGAITLSPAPTTSVQLPHFQECTTTLKLDLLQDIHLGNHTKTVHTTTVTSTKLYDCHGCRFLEIQNIGGVGPVLHFTTTVTDTATPAVETDYVCSKSSSNSALETAVPPTTQSPSPPPALPTP